MLTAIARSQIKLWFLAIRPITLCLSLAPVFVGSALAFAARQTLDLPVLLLTLLAAAAIQAGTNLLNDAEDFERGNDRSDRRGPPRVTAKGWASAENVRNGAAISLLIAAGAGLFLVNAGGWPIFGLGIFSVIAGIAYSAGPRPISYTPSGELFVFVFFGVLAVTGTYYLQAGELSAHAIMSGMAMGSLAAGVLHTNNTRDIREDRHVGRKTLAIVIDDLLKDRPQGPRKSALANTALYAFFILAPTGLLLMQNIFTRTDTMVAAHWLPVLSLPGVIIAIRSFSRARTGGEYNRLLGMTIGLQLFFATLLCAAWLI